MVTRSASHDMCSRSKNPYLDKRYRNPTMEDIMEELDATNGNKT